MGNHGKKRKTEYERGRKQKNHELYRKFREKLVEEELKEKGRKKNE